MISVSTNEQLRKKGFLLNQALRDHDAVAVHEEQRVLHLGVGLESHQHKTVSSSVTRHRDGVHVLARGVSQRQQKRLQLHHPQTRPALDRVDVQRLGRIHGEEQRVRRVHTHAFDARLEAREQVLQRRVGRRVVRNTPQRRSAGREALWTPGSRSRGSPSPSSSTSCRRDYRTTPPPKSHPWGRAEASSPSTRNREVQQRQ